MMNYRKELGILILVTIVIICTGYLIIYPENIGLCLGIESNCSNTIMYSLGKPLFYGFLYPLVILIILFFFTEKIYLSWKRFSKWCFPVFVTLVLVLKPLCSSIICLDRTEASVLLGKIFFGVSLLIIIGKYIQLWHKERKG